MAVGPFRPETPVVKQMGAKTGARNLLQKLFRDNCIGIDVGGIQWDNQPVCWVNFSAMVVSLFDAANVGEVAGNGGSGGHRRAD